MKAVGFVVLAALGLAHELPLGARIVPLLLAAGSVGAGVGLLRGKRWAWLLALCALLADTILVGGILRLLINMGMLLLLIRPQVRARFGMR